MRLLIANSKIICPSPGLKFKRPRRISQKESLNVSRIASWLREVWRKLFEKAMTKKGHEKAHATRYSDSSSHMRGEKGEIL